MDYTNSNPLAVRLTDTGGDYVSAGAGTQYAVDAALGATPTGTLAIGIRDDALGALTPIEGDAIGLRVDANGALWVIPSGTTVVSATNLDIRDLTAVDVVTANLSATDNAVLDDIAADTNSLAVVGGGLEATALRVTIASDSTGVLSIDDNAGSITVDGTFWQATQPVSLASVPSHAVTNAGTFAVQVDGAALTALQLIDNAVSGAGFNITQLNGAAVPIGAGLEATALRVTVATDSTGVLSVDDNGGALTVDGTVTANLSATDNAVLDQIELNTDPLLVVGGGVEATAIRVTIANDSTGILSVDDNGGNLSIDWAGTVPPIGAGLEATALRVTVATDSTGVVSVDDNGGALTVDGTVAVSSITTSVTPGTAAANLGKAEDGGHTSGDVGVMALGVRNDTPNVALAGTDLDYVPMSLTRTGAVQTMPAEEDFAVLGSNKVKKYYSAATPTDGIVWSPAAGKRWYITDIFIGVSAASTVTLEDDLTAGDSAVWAMQLAANSGWSHSFKTPLFSGEDAVDLILTSTAGTVYCVVTGYEI